MLITPPLIHSGRLPLNFLRETTKNSSQRIIENLWSIAGEPSEMYFISLPPSCRPSRSSVPQATLSAEALAKAGSLPCSFLFYQFYVSSF